MGEAAEMMLDGTCCQSCGEFMGDGDGYPIYCASCERDNKETTTMATGKVKWFNAAKGFGFIEPEEGGKDVFVHISALEASGLSNLDDGAAIEFETEDAEKGPQAVSVALL